MSIHGSRRPAKGKGLSLPAELDFLIEKRAGQPRRRGERRKAAAARDTRGAADNRRKSNDRRRAARRQADKSA
jgi:hypothetical protein